MVQLPSPPPNRPRPEPSGGEVAGKESIPFDMEDDDSPSEDFRLIKELASQILTQHDLSIIENMSFSQLMQSIMQKSIAVSFIYLIFFSFFFFLISYNLLLDFNF